jgi:hypothetical protein
MNETYQLMMKCAETAPYEDFHQAFRSFPLPFWICITLNVVIDLWLWILGTAGVIVKLVQYLVQYFSGTAP